MGETFYSALGVDREADAEAVRAAYRDLVKEHHPDVSDDPRAPERFKRLTTARDVLVDEEERARYDRLGHRSYVHTHLESPAWSGGGTPSGTGRSPAENGARSGDGRAASAERAQTGGERAAWLGEDYDPGPTGAGTGDPRRGGRGRHVRRSGAGGGGRRGTQQPDGQPWQQAGAAYRRSNAAAAAAAESAADSGSVREWVTSLGPWLGIHVAFVLSAAATAAFTLTRADGLGASLPGVLAAVALVGLVVLLSVLHIVSRVYT